MYVAMFKPLGMAIALVLTVIFLGYNLYLGRYVTPSQLSCLIFRSLTTNEETSNCVLIEFLTIAV